MLLLQGLNIYIKPISFFCELNQGRAGMETMSNNQFASVVLILPLDQHLCLTPRETVSSADLGSAFKVLALHVSE